MGTGSFLGVKSGRDVTLTAHPFLVPLVMKDSTPPMGRTACTEPQCLYKGKLYLFYLNTDFSEAQLIVSSIENFVAVSSLQDKGDTIVRLTL
jgi:hypothetical protein